MSGRPPVDVRARLLSEPMLWCWELIDRGGTVIQSSWAVEWTAYGSRDEALAAGRARLAALGDVADVRRPKDAGRGWRDIACGLAGVSVTTVPIMAWAQDRPADWSWGHPMSWMSAAWGLGMLVMMLLFWGAVITAIVFGLRWLAGQGERSRVDRALDILRERYARGEIPKDEFEAKQRDLR